MIESQQPNFAKTIADEVRKPVVLVPSGRGSVFVTPPGFQLQDAEPEDKQNVPHRKRGTVSLKTAGSFVEYVNRHKQPETLLYALVDPQNLASPLTITAVFNEHQTGDLCASDAGWRDFRAVLTPEASHEWKTWGAQSGKPMAQFEFATHLEDNIKDIASNEGYPTAPDMLRMATHFEASQDKRIRSAVRVQSGGVNIECIDTDDEATVERMQAFDKFMLGVPPFWRGQAYHLEAKLRYRVREGKLTLWYDLVRPDVVLNDAVDHIIEQVQAGTTLPILYGSILK